MCRVSIVELQNYWKNEIMPHYHVEKDVQLIFALYLKHLAMLQLGRELRVLQEIGEDNLLWPSNLCLRSFEDLDAGNLPGKVLISKHLHPLDA